MQVRSTRPDGPAVAGGGPPGSPSPQSPHPPDPAGTPWSAPQPRSGPAATRQATAPQHHHEPQDGYIITTVPKGNAIGACPTSTTASWALVLIPGLHGGTDRAVA